MTTLYNFTGPPGDAANPQGALALGESGVLYGTAGGGVYGTVFALQPPASPSGAWTETIIHDFVDLEGGDGPSGGVTIGAHGELYGTSTAGGNYGYECGAVFQLEPPAADGYWKENVLFLGFRVYNGCQPDGVAIGRDGALYGTTSIGGPVSGCLGNGCGTVFNLTPPEPPGAAWTEAVLFDFNGQNGSAPGGGLTIGPRGEVYGTTFFGGGGTAGTVFELEPPASPGAGWTQTVLYSFTNANGDGGGPDAGVVRAANGTLYGVTQNGGASGLGTVFELQPPASPGAAWSENIIYSFSGSDGAEPEAGLVIGPGPGRQPALYGTTWYGGSVPCAALGAPPGCGTVFVLTPPVPGGSWTETVLHSFTGIDGANPNGALVISLGAGGIPEIYGTTYLGGSSGNCNAGYPGQGCGTVFQVTLNGNAIRTAPSPPDRPGY